MFKLWLLHFLLASKLHPPIEIITIMWPHMNKSGTPALNQILNLFCKNI